MPNTWTTDLPSVLASLHQIEFDYADGEGIDFEPYPKILDSQSTRDWFRAWTGNDIVTGEEFRVFGLDGTGGYAAFWLVRSNEAILEQPVIFLGSEGERGVVSRSFDEYLWLLAAGIGPMEAVEYGAAPTDAGDKFLSFAKTHSRIAKVAPEELLRLASEAFPDFSNWIDNLCRY